MERIKHMYSQIIIEEIEQHNYNIHNPPEVMVLTHIKDILFPFIKNMIIQQQHYEIYNSLMIAEDNINTHINCEELFHNKTIDDHKELLEKVSTIRKEFEKNKKLYNKRHKL